MYNIDKTFYLATNFPELPAIEFNQIYTFTGQKPASILQ